MTEIRGTFDARGRRFAVAAARFNEIVTSKLVDGALACFRAHSVSEDDVLVVWVPGAFELPLAAQRLAATGLYDGVVCLGAVIRGETDHYDYVCAEAARGIQDVQLATGVPCAFGVLTVDNMEQALERSGGGKRDTGRHAAEAVVALARLREELGAQHR